MFNLKTLYQLEKGFHSYKANHVLWKSILIDDRSEENTDTDKSKEKDNDDNKPKETQQEQVHYKYYDLNYLNSLVTYFKVQLCEFYQNSQKGMIVFLAINIVVTFLILLS